MCLFYVLISIRVSYLFSHSLSVHSNHRIWWNPGRLYQLSLAQNVLSICLCLLTEMQAHPHVWVHCVYPPMDSVASNEMPGKKGTPQVQMWIAYDYQCCSILEKEAYFRRTLMACSRGSRCVSKGASAFQPDTLNNCELNKLWGPPARNIHWRSKQLQHSEKRL